MTQTRSENVPGLKHYYKHPGETFESPSVQLGIKAELKQRKNNEIIIKL